MKKLSYLIPLVLFVPIVALATDVGVGQGTFGYGLDGYLTTILNFINNYLIPFILGIAFLVFVWGIVSTFILGGQDEEKQKKGKQLMLYAIIAFIVIIAFWGLINLLADATGLGGKGLNQGYSPQVPGTTGGDPLP